MGLTTGFLSGLCHNIPNSPEEPLNVLYYYAPFAEPGDSGSLVYLPIWNKIVPIGIHKGSVGAKSYCLLSNCIVQTMETVLDRGLPILFVRANVQ